MRNTNYNYTDRMAAVIYLFLLICVAAAVISKFII